MSARACAIAGALLLALATALHPEEVPAAPDGFTWKHVPAVKASFLMPNGWFFLEEEKEGTHAFFITKEKIEDGGQFETGLTVNVQHLKKTSAPERAAGLIAVMREKYEALDSPGGNRRQGALEGFGCRVRVREKDQPSLIEEVLAIGNRRTNTLYILIFESSEARWPAEWEKGRVILDRFLLDDEF